MIPLLHDDLHLSESGVGILSSLPTFLFGFAAVPGSLLIAKLGVQRALIIGLLLTAIASALRGAVPDATLLFVMTFLMGTGIAIMQPSMPLVVRDWMPHRIGFGTAVYSNGLLVGETLSASLTIPLILPLVGGGWRLSFVVWALPVLVTALLVMAFAPHHGELSDDARVSRRRWWPDWRSPLIWRLGLIVGGINSLYFATNAFLPDYLDHHGHAELIGSALTALNLCQLPASFLMLAVADRLVGRRWPFVVSGLLSLGSVVGIILMPNAWVILWTSLLGFSNAAGFIVALALPPLLSPPHEVHRIASAMFTISYSYTMMIPIIGGLAWDVTGIPELAFVPIGLCAVIMVGFAATLDLSRHRR